MFVCEEYTEDYKAAEPKPYMHNFHKGIQEHRNAYMKAKEAKASKKELDKLDMQGEAYKADFLQKMIEYCYNNNIPTIPVHIELQPDIWWAAHNILIQRRKAAGMRNPSEALQRLRNEEEEQKFEMNDGSHECQYTFRGRKTYWVQCGPLRCGKVLENGNCPHGLIVLLDHPPPGWVDGAGWKDGLNYFQIANEGLWANPRYGRDKKDIRHGPWIKGPAPWEV
ncbi:hypothetical protein BKA66DRAFT_442611 [Pyrenochaeta sp. MPI-SDFR-AT-0127]|nr:hypothetical protein BKA66DRAFT_442611 [Pyrenochaeta sp. MPI-SDFR-AT-0127]